MSALQSTWRILAYEQRTFWRRPQAAFFTLFLPLLMLVVFSVLNEHDLDAQGQPYARYLLVGMLTFAIANTAYGNLAARIVHRRETGIFQRFRTTPLPAGALVAGSVLCALVVGLVAAALLLGVAALGLDVALPRDWATFALVALLGTACCCALGAAVSTFVSSIDSADPVVFGTVLPLAFISGTFQYVAPDTTLTRIASVFPVRHIVLGTMDAFGLPGTGSLLAHVGVLLAWTALGVVVAVRRFRWAPSR